MSKLFELYAFKKLREIFPKHGDLIYHLKANRQELDFLLNHTGENSEKIQMVIDAKYKPRYENGNISTDDARMKSIYKTLNVDRDILIDNEGLNPNQFYVKTGLANGFLNTVGDKLRKPSIEKIKKSFPYWSMDYLLLGKGEMLIENNTKQTADPVVFSPNDVAQNILLDLLDKKDKRIEELVKEITDLKSQLKEAKKKINLIQMRLIIEMWLNKR